VDPLPTRLIADRVVDSLSAGLASVRMDMLPTIRSVYLGGSYVRGDWLDASSDLDVEILYRRAQSSETSRAADLSRIKAIAQAALPPQGFASQCPGGIDWSTQPAIPTTAEDARTVGPFLYHSVFLFDRKENVRVLWGEDVKTLLATPPDPRSLSAQAMDLLLSRVRSLADDDEGRRRAAYSSYKATLVAQLHFGERTLSKWRILDLYLRNVPSFPFKHVGEHIIRAYLGAEYPGHPPVYRSLQDYVRYVTQLRGVLG
jgi:hypothetical protein